jgi:hypothetical protein
MGAHQVTEEEMNDVDRIEGIGLMAIKHDDGYTAVVNLILANFKTKETRKVNIATESIYGSPVDLIYSVLGPYLDNHLNATIFTRMPVFDMNQVDPIEVIELEPYLDEMIDD